MKRNTSLNEIEDPDKIWDLVVIGGGATGLGVALDALSRGLSVVLVEKADFAKGTSSRSTKLLHGGVRYLAQGDVGLVFEALKERGLMMKNAPHVSRKQAFVIPIYSFWDRLKYTVGLKIYDLMAGSLRIGKSTWISKKEIIDKIPPIKKDKLQGGVVYYDGQFDDARYAVNIAQTCADMGGTLINYTEVVNLSKDEKGKVNGVKVKDLIGGVEYELNSKAVVNATGVFADTILKMDDPNARKSIKPSQGAHLVLDLSFLGGKNALMIPETPDGRVLFGIPWHGKLLLGTTDTIRKNPKMEPRAMEKEIDFILETCADYLERPPTREDVLSVFAGLRPLAAPKEKGAKTKEISRSHKVTVSDSNLVSIIGGKWTTYRKMGEDTLAELDKRKLLTLKKSTSEDITMHGFPDGETEEGHLGIYGSDAKEIWKLIDKDPFLGEKLHSDYPNLKAEVVWAVREEMAMKVEDVLARRMRTLFLDANAALAMAPQVAELMSKELGTDQEWVENEVAAFEKLASRYLIKT